MHGSAARSIGAACRCVPPATLAALVALLASIVVVEVGLRDPGPGMLVSVPAPAMLEPVLDHLRSVPLTSIDDPRAAAVASGVIFGRTDHVLPADEEAFLASGLWHLLAASGQNIALVAGCCVLLARGVGAGRTTGGVLALVAIPAYVLVVGGGASIVRAGIMGELALLAWLTGRLPDVRHMLVSVAAIICWAWPGAHRGLGMQLSFACVVALAWWAEPVTRELRERGMPAWLAASVAATGLCSIATAPILLLRTDAAPVLGIVANVVAVPIAAGLLVVGLAGTLVALAGDAVGSPAIGTWAMLPSELLASMLLRVAQRASALPLAQTTSPLVAFGAPVMAVVSWRMRARRTHRRLVALVAAAVLLGIGASMVLDGDGAAAPLARDGLRIAVLDIGQGDSTLLVQGEAAVLVDVGPPDGRVVDRVRALGVRRIDGIVLTHDSLDHRGGFDRALAALGPSWVAMPRAAAGPWQRIRDAAPRLVELCAGDAFDVGAAHVDVLHPRCDGVVAPRTGDLHNDGAMVLLVSHGGIRALLPADAEAPVLVELGLPELDLLRVSHHGSRDERLDDLLARTRPEAAAISVGEGNTYGHPTRPTLDSLARAGVDTWRTDRDGTVVFDSDGRTLRLAS